MTAGCEENRESLSALLDGELKNEARTATELHLAACVECQSWFEASQTLGRTLSIRAEVAPAGLADRVLDRTRPQTVAVGSWVRYALGVVAASVFVLSLPALFAVGVDAEHSMRHAGAFGVALGIGLAWAAWHPERASGLVPLALALITAVVAGSLFDIATGRAAALSEATHALELVGVALLVLLAGGGVSGIRRNVENTIRSYRSTASA